MSSDAILETYLRSARQQFAQYKELAEKAISQVPEAAIGTRLDDDSNSIATLMQHIAGNLISRWTDFLTTDGEKPSRQRDAEFEDDPATSVAALLDQWERAWRILFASLDALGPADLGRTVTIRDEPHAVVQAVNRQLTHNAYHVGQIVLLARHYRKEDWRSLSIPRKRSGPVS